MQYHAIERAPSDEITSSGTADKMHCKGAIHIQNSYMTRSSGLIGMLLELSAQADLLEAHQAGAFPLYLAASPAAAFPLSEPRQVMTQRSS